jgi:hypothetical protein
MKNNYTKLDIIMDFAGINNTVTICAWVCCGIVGAGVGVGAGLGYGYR